MRYKNTLVFKDKNLKRYYRPTIVPNIPLSDSDVYVYPKVGERLDLLAYQFYGDSNLWWIIAKANELTNGQIGLSSEKKIRIPVNIQPILKNL
tara:strand:+ start:382 stop:660 length:279 start_codon:yes stop_codon:yes gene_type:complete